MRSTVQTQSNHTRLARFAAIWVLIGLLSFLGSGFCTAERHDTARSHITSAMPPGGTTQPSLWLEANVGVYQGGARGSEGAAAVNPGDVVGLWEDQSGNNADVSATANRPTFAPNALNGKPGIAFAAASSQKLSPLPSISPATIFVVGMAQPDGNHHQAVGAAGAAGNPLRVHLSTREFGTPTPAWENIRYECGGTFLHSACFAGQPFVLTLRVTSAANNPGYTANSSQLYVDGKLIASGSTGGISLAITGTNGAVGAGYTGGFTDYFNGTLSEVILYNTDLGDTERAVIENYLIAKYGLPNPYASYRYYRSDFTVSSTNYSNEQLFLSGSDDLIHWNPLYSNYLTAFGGTTGGSLRDPSLFFDVGANLWFIAYTTPSTAGTTQCSVFGVASSPDLVTWTPVATPDCSSITGTGTGARTWAPEWFVDSDGSIHLFIALSSTVGGAGTFGLYELHPTNAALTSWSTPAALSPATSWYSSAPIDPQVVLLPQGSAARYALWYVAGGSMNVATANSLSGPWTNVHTGNWFGLNSGSGNGGAVTPTTAPTVNVTGGGSSGGVLAAGTYYAKYTYNTAGGETVASGESAPFTVAAGDIPTVTLPAFPLPATVLSWNCYLTAVSGASGSETLYASGINSSAFACSSFSQGTQTPPAANTQFEGPCLLVIGSNVILYAAQFNTLPRPGSGSGIVKQLYGDYSNPASTPVWSSWQPITVPYGILLEHGTITPNPKQIGRRRIANQ